MKFFSHSKLTAKKHFKHNKTLKRIILYMISPCIILGALIIFMFRYSINQQTDNYKTSCINSINVAFTDVEYKINGISESMEVLSYNAQFVTALSETLSDNSESYELLKMILKNIRKSSKYIDSTIIYDKAGHKVSFNSALYDSAIFFDKYSYVNYSPTYWYNYRFPISESRFLSPTKVIENKEQKNIVPLVYTRLGKNYLNKLLIVNINLDKILNDTISEFPINIVNKQTMMSFSSAAPGKSFNLSDEMINIMKKNNLYTGALKMNGKKNLFVYYSPSTSFLGYSYYSLVPYSFIYSKTFGLIVLLISLGLTISVAAIFTILFGSRKIFVPISEIARSLGSENEPDTFKYIDEAVKKIKASNTSLDTRYQDSLSKIQKLYLINLLNTDEDSLVKPELNEYFSFKHEYFCSCIYKVLPSEDFSILINSSDYSNIISELFICIKEEYSAHFDCTVLPSDYNVLYIVINFPTPKLKKDIENINMNLLNILKTDADAIKVVSSFGEVHQGLDGLKRSHREALFKINKNIGAAPLKISVNVTSSTENDRYVFKLSDESTLLNYLVSFKTDLANELIDKILNENIHNGISENELRKLYIKFITIIANVLDAKQIEYSILDCNSALSAIPNMLTVPLVELHDIVSTLIKNLKLYLDSHHQHLNITNIINYIEENCNNDLYLDGIAEVFQTSPKYLSKLIKSKLGISFTDYLNEYRIKQAMKMLKEDDDIKINELYSKVGFNNRNSFSNYFKKFAGMSPSEYKKTLKTE